MNKNIQKLINFLGKDKVKEKIPLSDLTTFKIGGPADFFFEAKNKEDLLKAVKLAREFAVPYVIIGGGSNVLVSDEGFRGLVIKAKNEKIKILTQFGNEAIIYSEAGTSLSKLLRFLSLNELSGLEFMAGIPGTVGGAIRGNAGAWQQAIGDKIVEVEVLKDKSQVVLYSAEDCQFSYRNSIFKKNNQDIVLSGKMRFLKSRKELIEKKTDEYLSKRASQPKEPSAGCVFINPKPLSAGALIEESGLKGVQIGGAKISEKHANFIVNVGGATAKDVISLINLVKDKVREKFSIELEEEIVKIGNFN